MSKRKEPHDEDSKHQKRDSSEDEKSDVAIDFEWFDPQEVDFHGLKQLLKQLFDADHERFDLSGLASLVIAQPLLGSTVKVADEVNDAKDNDPFAFLSVLSLWTHRENEAIKSLVQYLTAKASNIPNLGASFAQLLASASEARVGLVLTERFINMPAAITPPMYNMLVEEIGWAVQEKEPYEFSHYLVLSRVYGEVESEMLSGDEDEDEGEGEVARPAKKKKRRDKSASKAGGHSNVFYYHAEDEVLQRYAVAHGSYRYDKERADGASDAKRAFQDAGITTQGHLILIEAGKFEEAVKAMGEYLSA